MVLAQLPLPVYLKLDIIVAQYLVVLAQLLLLVYVKLDITVTHLPLWLYPPATLTKVPAVEIGLNNGQYIRGQED